MSEPQGLHLLVEFLPWLCREAGQALAGGGPWAPSGEADAARGESPLDKLSWGPMWGAGTLLLSKPTLSVIFHHLPPRTWSDLLCSSWLEF